MVIKVDANVDFFSERNRTDSYSSSVAAVIGKQKSRLT